MLGQPPPTRATRSRRANSAAASQPTDTSQLTDEEYLELKERLEKFQDTLRRMAKNAGNKRCADCREHHPRYIDVTWGVYLCLLCSGAHQKTLGSTVVTVDTTEADQQWIDTLEQRGNEKVNDDLEYKLDVEDKRKMSWSITNRAKFVQRKYVNGEWIRKNPKIDLKNPSKVAAPVESFDEPKKKKKKDKKKKKKKSKKTTEEPPMMAMPAQEQAKSSAPAPQSNGNNGLTDLFGLLSTEGDAKQQPVNTQQPSKSEAKVDGKAIFGEPAKPAGVDIMAMFDTQTTQTQAGYGGGMQQSGYGMQGGAQRGTQGGMMGTNNPFMSAGAGQQAGNPFATGGYAPQPQQGYGYGGGYGQQPGMNQNQMWQMQQQQAAYQQQMKTQQVQQAKQQQQKADDILSFF